MDDNSSWPKIEPIPPAIIPEDVSDSESLKDIIVIDAEVRQIKSMADGTYNIILNTGEYNIDQIGKILTWINDLAKVVIVRKDG